MSTARLRNLGCPSCGGVLPYAEGLRLVRCSYCESQAAVLGGAGVARQYVEPLVDRASLAALLSRTFQLPTFAEGFEDAARTMDARLLFVPFYEIEALRAVRSRRTVTRPGKTGEVDTCILLAGVRFFTPAIADDRFGLAAIEAPELRGPDSHVTIRAFEVAAIQRLGNALDPDVPLEPLLEKLRSGKASRDTETLEETATVLYYPVWHVLLRHRGNGYRVVVDAVGRQVLAGRAPGNARLRAWLPVAALGLLAWAFGRLLRVVLLGAGTATPDYTLSLWAIPGLAAVTLAGFVVAGEAWRTLRYAYEVEWIGGIARLTRVGEPDQSWLEQLIERAQEALGGAGDAKD